jgi:hypothetical protein
MPPVATPEAINARLSAAVSTGRTCFDPSITPFHIGQENQLPRAEGRRAGHRHLVRVHVVDVALAVAGHAGHHRQIAVGGQQFEQAGIGSGDAAHRAQRRVELLGLHQQASMPVSPTASARAVQARHQFVIHAAGEDFQHGVHGFRRGDPQAAHEAAFDAALGQIAGHLLAAAVHHHEFDAGSAPPPRSRPPAARAIRVVEQRAAEFHQHARHSRPSVSG